MEEVAEFARAGGLVLGICNGFQVLCEAGLLPGALLPNTSLRFIFRQVSLEVASTDSPFTRRVRRSGERLSIPVKHTTGRYYAPDDDLDELEAAGQVLLRYAPGQNPNGSLDDIAGVCNEAPQRVRPDAPPRARRRPAHRLHRRPDRSSSRSAPRLPTAPSSSPDRHRELGLTDAEYELIVERLGREPGRHRAGDALADVVRALRLQALEEAPAPAAHRGPARAHGPRRERRRGRRRRRASGVAFKVESHNHPSAVEPFQGAATGVGGILRDVFAVGARPIAVLDSLRFGEPASSERSRYLLEHAVAGIGHYGNSIGVPTVGGEIYFEPSYEQNCLINAMCLGLAPHERLIRSAAAGPGNVLVLLGALTGRDGIGGASVLASAELGEGDEAKRPSVQIGDPFAEKKLLECCLELLDCELLVSLQDLGAAGLTSSASEMAARATSAWTSTARGCRCARPGWSRSRSWSPSPRSGCCAWSSLTAWPR